MPCGQTADDFPAIPMPAGFPFQDRKSTRLNSSHSQISYAVFCLKKKKKAEEILVMRSFGVRIGEIIIELRQNAIPFTHAVVSKLLLRLEPMHDLTSAEEEDHTSR